MAKVCSKLRLFHVPNALPFSVYFVRDLWPLTLMQCGVLQSRYFGSQGKIIELRSKKKKRLDHRNESKYNKKYARPSDHRGQVARLVHAMVLP
jgi:hypothetical protein